MALYDLWKEVKENPKGSNTGKEVDKINFPFGYKIPWCASHASDCNKRGYVLEPIVRSARAKDFIKGNTHGTIDIIIGSYDIKTGDYIVCPRSGGNHIDEVLWYDKIRDVGYKIGGNVGDKVTIRKFTLKSLIAQKAIITEVIGFYDYSLPQSEFTDWLITSGFNVSIEGPKEKPTADTIYQSGVASYYAGKFHGRKTASGEIYDSTKMTAAHLKLPFGTIVSVKNVLNNKSIEVEITDDGPHVTGRVIDLSWAGAEKLGLKLGKVEVRIIKLSDKRWRK